MPQPKLYENHAQRQKAYNERRERARCQQMAAKGLPALSPLPNVPGWPRWNQAVNNAKTLMVITEKEMQSYYNERSEQWQESEKAETFQERLDALTDLCQLISEWLES